MRRMIALAALAFLVTFGGVYCSNREYAVDPYTESEQSLHDSDLPPTPGAATYVADAPRKAEYVEEVIGPQGGSVSAGDITVLVPRGAVDGSVVFSIRRPGHNSDQSRPVLAEFGPHNVDFAEPVSVRFSTKGTSAAGVHAYLARWDQGRSEWTGLATTLVGSDFVQAETEHFSSVALHPCVPAVDPTAEGCPSSVPDNCASCAGIYNGWSFGECTSHRDPWFIDEDRDGFDDYCENDLASDFAPELRLASDCNWDTGLDRMGGEYYHVAQPFVDTIRLGYLPAYYLDCGAPTVLAQPHTGDSEFIFLDATFNSSSNHWRTRKVFLSAHCKTPNDGDCMWWGPGHFFWVDDISLGAPVVWVSLAKHANFPNKDVCDGSKDSCVHSGPTHRFPVGQEGNIGSSHHRFVDCTTGRSSSTMKDTGETECLWGWNRFNGWQANEEGIAPTGYGEILFSFGFYHGRSL